MAPTALVPHKCLYKRFVAQHEAIKTTPWSRLVFGRRKEGKPIANGGQQSNSPHPNCPMPEIAS